MEHEVQFGTRKRMSFSRIDEIQDMPNLIEVQKNSYRRFVEHDLKEVFDDISPIVDFSEKLIMEFVDYKIDFDHPKYSVEECKERDVNFSAPLRVKVRLVRKDMNDDVQEVKEQEVFMGDFPLMTDNGTFIINGAERVIVSQLVRSPGVYFDSVRDKKEGKLLYTAQVIPNRGAWLEYETDSSEILYVKIDRQRKIHITSFLRALGFASDSQILDIFGEDERLRNTLEKDVAHNEEEGLNEIYKRLRPGEPFTEESARTHLNSLFFDKRYDLARVGRYKFNKKLSLATRITGQFASEPVIDPQTGEVLVDADDFIDADKALTIENAGITYVEVKTEAGSVRVVGNRFVDAACYLDFDPIKAELNEKVHYPTLMNLKRAAAGDVYAITELAFAISCTDKALLSGKRLHELYNFVDEAAAEKDPTAAVEKLRTINIKLLGDDAKDKRTPREIASLCALILDNSDEDRLEKLAYYSRFALIPRHITKDDIIASVSYLIGLRHGLGLTDDIDHLGNRRIRSVGELLQNQIRIGLTRLERSVRERMSVQDMDVLTPSNLINIRPVIATIKEFFGSSQLSQFMDQTNPLAELTHKRRLSALGPGGLNRDRATFEVRDVHFSHYGRMCPIETPEGPNIGLINSLSTYARINEYGFIEAPYRVVDKENRRISTKKGDVVYLTADVEEGSIVAQANEPMVKVDDDHIWFAKDRIVARRLDQIIEVDSNEIDYMDVSPKQLVSVATSMIPFLENDDSNRALMGSNMQRQAVPLLVTEAPFVGTGMEYKAAYDSGVVVVAKQGGIVKSISADRIIIEEKDGNLRTYKLIKFKRSNQGTCINQRPIVSAGDVIKNGQVLADGASTEMGEIALGRNILIGFMTWEGYNYEDAVLISEKLVKDDVYTSIHIEEHEIEARDTKLGSEEITRDVTNVGEDALANLDDRGIIRIGAEVRSGDILVGKVTPKGETELTAEERLLRAIFGEKAREVRDTSLRVPHGEDGIVVDVKVFTRENKDELAPGVNQLVRVYIAQKRKISVGDKMAGRHGNKGVISRILPEEDMPFLPDGTPLQIVLNPLGVPSRMNIGQILELHLGLAAKQHGWHIATPVFDGATEEDIKRLLASTHKERNKEILQNVYGLCEETAELVLSEPLLTVEAESAIRAELSGENIDAQVERIRTLLLESCDGKTVLYDGRTGERFENRISVGYMYYLKLHHLVDDKIHARSTGPYSLVTQQPLGGKAQFGGQRFGEMEVWALEAYGAANTLQEILTVKSDDVVGRVKTYESIVKGENVPEPGVPESFRVLIKELQSLALDVKVINDKNEELNISDSYDDDDKVPLDVNIAGREDAPGNTPGYIDDGDFEDFDGFDADENDDDDEDDGLDEFDGFSLIDGDGDDDGEL